MSLRTFLDYLIKGVPNYAIYDKTKEPVAIAIGEGELKRRVVEFTGKSFRPLTLVSKDSGVILSGSGENYYFKVVEQSEARKIEGRLEKEVEEAKKRGQLRIAK